MEANEPQLAAQPQTSGSSSETDPPTTQGLRSELVHAGEKCPTCERKVPHPRQENSPKSRTYSFKIPVDDYDAFLENVQEAMRESGADERKYAPFRFFDAAAVLALQSADDVREYLVAGDGAAVPTEPGGES